MESVNALKGDENEHVPIQNRRPDCGGGEFEHTEVRPVFEQTIDTVVGAYGYLLEETRRVSRTRNIHS
jgi:hypothetical protein